MIHPQQHIVDLSEILYQRGVSYVVISPGSRNAPLIKAFYRRFTSKCISIIDERSAAYVGLGLARQSKAPVVLLCTSGTAVLNYAPALAEAYYQCIPLIAITADRPAEWIDQQDNQTIRQQDVFKNYVKAGYHLKETYNDGADLLKGHEMAHKAFTLSSKASQGPVHINVPLREPLYHELPDSGKNIKQVPRQIESKAHTHLDILLKAWNAASKIMLIHGQEQVSSKLQKSIQYLCADPRVVCIAENIANLHDPNIISSPDLLLAKINADQLPIPDLLLYAGGQIVSKRLKNYLRSLPALQTWRIGVDNYPIDTFKQNNKQLSMLAHEVYDALGQVHVDGTNLEFKSEWHRVNQFTSDERDKYTGQMPFSDLQVVKSVLEHVPPKAILELGNSSVIRLSQLFNLNNNIIYHSNRGVSGIDGCVSAAVGTAMATEKLVVSVVGDLSFLYDSNGLWNRQLPNNFRLIVINNKGGGIFGLIPGPSNTDGYEKFLLAHHPVQIEKLVEAYKLNYFCASSHEELNRHLPDFFDDMKGAAVMEVNTTYNNNIAAYKGLYKAN